MPSPGDGESGDASSAILEGHRAWQRHTVGPVGQGRHRHHTLSPVLLTEVGDENIGGHLLPSLPPTQELQGGGGRAHRSVFHRCLDCEARHTEDTKHNGWHRGSCATLASSPDPAQLTPARALGGDPPSLRPVRWAGELPAPPSSRARRAGSAFCSPFPRFCLWKWARCSAVSQLPCQLCGRASRTEVRKARHDSSPYSRAAAWQGG